MTEVNRGIFRMGVGEFTVTALNDGQFEAPAAWVAGLSPSALEHQLAESFRPFPPRITLNAFLVEHRESKVLVDAGAGGKFGPAMGAVGRHLATLGVDPNAIGTILLTHAHVDHVGGLTDGAGAALFPRATLVVNQFENAFWRDDSLLAHAPESAKSAFQAARGALDAYKGRLRLIGDGIEAAPGIRARSLPGHTPGHTGYQVGSGTESLLIWGDIVHLPGVQFDRPDVGMTFDADGEQAIETRRAILDEAVESRMMVAGMHLDFPTFAHVRRDGDHYALVPKVWTPSA